MKIQTKPRIVKIPILLSLVLSAAQHPSVKAQELQDGELKGVVITMKQENHRGCIACCPTYSVTMSGDGTVTSEGIANVSVTGKQIYSIQTAQVKELVGEFYKVDFFSLKDEYTFIDNGDGTKTMIDHTAPVTTSITIKDRTKSVYNFFGAPDKLKELQKKIYELSGIDLYVKRAQQITRPGR